jgi:hypothetical protein
MKTFVHQPFHSASYLCTHITHEDGVVDSMDSHMERISFALLKRFNVDAQGGCK